MKREAPPAKRVEAAGHPVLLESIKNRWTIAASNSVIEYEAGPLYDRNNVRDFVYLINWLQNQSLMPAHELNNPPVA